jgi:hypothetical protein
MRGVAAVQGGTQDTPQCFLQVRSTLELATQCVVRQ